MNHPLFLLSGMGADARVFEQQCRRIPLATVPAWIDPLPHESLSSYAMRLARRIDPGVPCFIGGASFGGLVAVEMMPYLDVLACFLVGSVRAAKELPPAIRSLRRMAGAAQGIPFEVVQAVGPLLLWSSGFRTAAHGKTLLEQLSNADASFLRWACEAVLSWDGPSVAPTRPIHQIHGEHDPILPVRYTKPDVVVPGGGHALSMSHPDAVTEFLAGAMRSMR
jgi:pimeloyl-ACP methyl ester carboxylesterase